MGQTLRCAGIIAIVLALVPMVATGQQFERYSNKELRLMVANASNADDYQKLATYFHYEELMYRAKAQKIMDEYANYGAKHPMATKTISRTDVESRLYQQYSAKADENSALAARYDELLTQLGVKPAIISSTVVSARSLQRDSTGTPGAALVDNGKQQKAGDETSKAEPPK